MIERTMTDRQRDRFDVLTVAVGCALTKMKSAGLADFGTIPKDALLLTEKSEEYTEVLMWEDGEPLDVAIDVECVERATKRICALPSVKAGERNPVPTAGEFARFCREEWHSLYRHVGVPMIRGGVETTAIIAVRRDASDVEVAMSIERARARAIGAGCLALPKPQDAPVPSAETRKRMHRKLGWEAPDA